jgi:polysaccharide biosynthesis/export protein
MRLSASFCGVFRSIALAALPVLAGCSQNQFSATKLPLEYTAPPNENMEEIDLSRLKHWSTNSELIDRGDVLDVTMMTNYSTLTATTAPVRVADNGMGDIPLIGPVALAGLEIEAAEAAIGAAAVARGIFQKPNITVTMRRQRSNRITVIGAVKQPGAYNLPRGSSSLLAAIVAAGGLTDDGGPEIEIRRSLAVLQPPPPPGTPFPPLVVPVNIAKAAQEDDRNHCVGDGDVVVVHRRAPKPLYVIGLVQKPGEYRLPPNQTLQLLDALALAGERSTPLADKVLVIRHVPCREQPVLIVASVHEAKHNGNANLRLAPGDIVSVEDTPLTLIARVLAETVRFTVGGGLNVWY